MSVINNFFVTVLQKLKLHTEKELVIRLTLVDVDFIALFLYVVFDNAQAAQGLKEDNIAEFTTSWGKGFWQVVLCL